MSSGSNYEFTRRELEVIQLLSEGLNRNEIAERLCLSPTTVHTHLGNVYSKFRPYHEERRGRDSQVQTKIIRWALTDGAAVLKELEATKTPRSSSEYQKHPLEKDPMAYLESTIASMLKNGIHVACKDFQVLCFFCGEMINDGERYYRRTKWNLKHGEYAHKGCAERPITLTEVKDA